MRCDDDNIVWMKRVTEKGVSCGVYSGNFAHNGYQAEFHSVGSLFYIIFVNVLVKRKERLLGNSNNLFNFYQYVKAI